MAVSPTAGPARPRSAPSGPAAGAAPPGPSAPRSGSSAGSGRRRAGRRAARCTGSSAPPLLVPARPGRPGRPALAPTTSAPSVHRWPRGAPVASWSCPPVRMPAGAAAPAACPPRPRRPVLGRAADARRAAGPAASPAVPVVRGSHRRRGQQGQGRGRRAPPAVACPHRPAAARGREEAIGLPVVLLLLPDLRELPLHCQHRSIGLATPPPPSSQPQAAAPSTSTATSRPFT